MNPFTADARILERALGSEGGIWREMSGTIQSLRIFDRTEQDRTTQTQSFSVEIKTDESVVRGLDDPGPKACTGVFRVEAVWSFMELKQVSVKKLRLDCR